MLATMWGWTPVVAPVAWRGVVGGVRSSVEWSAWSPALVMSGAIKLSTTHFISVLVLPPLLSPTVRTSYNETARRGGGGGGGAALPIQFCLRHRAWRGVAVAVGWRLVKRCEQ